MKNGTFLAGMLAGGVLFSTGLMLGGAGSPGGRWGGRPEASSEWVSEYQTIKARRIELVDRDGCTVLEMKGADGGASLTLLDGQGDRRVKLTSEGAVTVFDEQGRLRARMTAENNLHSPSVQGGQMMTFNAHGQASGRLVN